VLITRTSTILCPTISCSFAAGPGTVPPAPSLMRRRAVVQLHLGEFYWGTAHCPTRCFAATRGRCKAYLVDARRPKSIRTWPLGFGKHDLAIMEEKSPGP